MHGIESSASGCRRVEPSTKCTTGLAVRSRQRRSVKEIHRRSPGGGGTHTSTVPSTSATRTFNRRGILRPPPTPRHTHSTERTHHTRNTEHTHHTHNTEHTHHAPNTEHILRVLADALRSHVALIAQQLMRTWWRRMSTDDDVQVLQNNFDCHGQDGWLPSLQTMRLSG